jgi:hypothetical protein
MNKLISTNTNYLLKPGHDQLFLETKEWKSDLEFYKIELSFLEKLLDKTFLRITTRTESVELELLNKKIKETVLKKLIPLSDRISLHEKYFESLEEKTFSISEENIWEEHLNVNHEINTFIRDVKMLKHEIFIVVEKIMRLANKASSDFVEGNVTL